MAQYSSITDTQSKYFYCNTACCLHTALGQVSQYPASEGQVSVAQIPLCREGDTAILGLGHRYCVTEVVWPWQYRAVFSPQYSEPAHRILGYCRILRDTAGYWQFMEVCPCVSHGPAASCIPILLTGSCHHAAAPLPRASLADVVTGSSETGILRTGLGHKCRKWAVVMPGVM